MIKAGTKFLVCSCDILEKKGWTYYGSSYSHNDFPGNTIVGDMMEENEGKILTVVEPVQHQKGWYVVEENDYDWPVETFLEEDAHICEEGMTAIDGWVICKHCGNNLRQLK